MLRQIESAAECVTELVVEGHADRAQARTAEPSTVERIRACSAIAWLNDDPRQRTYKHGHAF
jgi:hypothetical protein